MIFNDFSGGLHNRLHPSVMPHNKAITYTNIDNEKQVLVPHKKDKLMDFTPDNFYWHWFTKADVIVSNAYIGTYIEFRQWLYYFAEADIPNKALKYNKDNPNLPQAVGVEKPPPIVVTNQETTTVETYKGTVTYTSTYYSPDTGIESEPSEATVAGTFTDYMELTLGGFASKTGFVTRIYRTDDVLGRFTLIGEVNPQDDSFVDTVKATEVAGAHILDSYGNTPPDTKLKYVTEAHTVFCGAIDNKLYYSKPAKPEYWPKENYIEFDTDITGIAYIQNGILVFTKYKTYIVTGTSSNTFAAYLLNGNIGCESHYSIQFINNGAIWYSNKGVVWSSGGDIQLISYPELGEIDFTVISSVAVHRQYVLATDKGVYLFDFRLGLAIKKIENLGE